MAVTVAFGNPLLDISLKISNNDLLEKYHLQEDDQIEINKSQMLSLLTDISTFKLSLSAGGSAQNTLRILQWLLKTPNSTIMVGAIGNDPQGENLRAIVEKDGVTTRYIVHEGATTGTSVALTNNTSRSLMAYIGAAEQVTTNHIDQSLIQNADLIYMESFFVIKRPQVIKFINELITSNEKIFAFNISAAYTCQEEPEAVKSLAENCDILFSNRRDFEVFARLMGADDSESAAVNLCKNYCRTEFKKMVVITNGSEFVTCVHSGGKIEVCDVPKLDELEIGDTTGAGDAFVAGFLAAFFAKHNPVVCIKWGCWTARQIIKQIGCRVPDYSADFIQTIQ